MSPTQRSLAYLRKLGYHAAVVEKWNAFAGPRINGKPVGQRQDLWGVFDLLAITQHNEAFTEPHKCGVLAVQATSGSNAASRVTKIVASEVARDWLLAGNRIEVYGWAKRGPHGKAKRWTVNVRPVTLADFPVSPTIPTTDDTLLFAKMEAP